MDVEARVISILSELSGETKINNNATLQEDLTLDSLSLVTLLVEIEEAFEIQLDETDMNPFDLVIVQDVIDMVRKYLGDSNEHSC